VQVNLLSGKVYPPEKPPSQHTGSFKTPRNDYRVTWTVKNKCNPASLFAYGFSDVFEIHKERGFVQVDLLTSSVFQHQPSHLTPYTSRFEEPNSRFQVWWLVQGEEITLEMWAKTHGWISINLTDSTMPGSDMWIGDIDNEEPSLTDRYAKGYFTPETDSEQNLLPLTGLQDSWRDDPLLKKACDGRFQPPR